MWLVNLLSVAVAASFFVTSCQSELEPDAEAEVETRTERLGSLNRYYLTTWQNVMDGTMMQLVDNTAAAINALPLTGTENVAIVVHGREGSANSEFGHALRDTLILKDRDMAVILVDWALVSSLDYNQAAFLVPFVAEDLIDFIKKMELSNKLDRGLLHLIGFDLGAHIVGITSRNAYARARKITALSPAGDGWDMCSQRLRVTDAQFVETIHTNADGRNAFGITGGIGGLEFFPNGGSRQPGCFYTDNWCHHNRAWQLFAATVEMGGHLWGQICESMTQVSDNRCGACRTAPMGGLDMFKTEVGLHRVTTGRAYPYDP